MLRKGWVCRAGPGALACQRWAQMPVLERPFCDNFLGRDRADPSETGFVGARMMTSSASISDQPANAPDDALARRLDRPLVFIGLMGAGKSVIGRRVAERLDLPFRDSDTEIESASGLSVATLFEDFGEAEFRDLERRVMARLMDEGACVIATGGGAFMQPATRALILERGIAIWLRADLDILVERTGRHDRRPLLRGKDRRSVLAALMAEREPVYAEAPIAVMTDQGSKDAMVERVLAALFAYLEGGDAESG